MERERNAVHCAHEYYLLSPLTNHTILVDSNVLNAGDSKSSTGRRLFIM